jgi:hypothetical protein
MTGPSTNFAVQIGPRDPAQLVKVCEELTDEAMDSDSPYSWTAGEALRHVVDPVVVPCLKRLSQTNAFSDAIEGLSLIANAGDSAAMAALVSIANHGKFSWVRDQASHAIKAIRAHDFVDPDTHPPFD